MALHLRFEEDMLAHSGCVYWGGVQEQQRWAEMRRKREWPVPTKSDFQLRDHGKCPPSPEEVGTWLQGLGFDSSTHIYMAAGKLYDEKRAMAPFYAMFPHIFTKDMLVTKREAAFMRGKSNIRAAVDMHVLVNADVTALTFEGMMGEIVMGAPEVAGPQEDDEGARFRIQQVWGVGHGTIQFGKQHVGVFQPGNTRVDVHGGGGWGTHETTRKELVRGAVCEPVAGLHVSRWAEKPDD